MVTSGEGEKGGVIDWRGEGSAYAQRKRATGRGAGAGFRGGWGQLDGLMQREKRRGCGRWE